MADLGYHYRQRTDLEDNIRAQRRINQRLKAEFEALDNAFKNLEEMDVTGRAKSIQKEVSVKNLGSDLEWRGSRKNDYDKMIEGEPKEKAKQFRKAVDKFKSDVKKARRAKEQEWHRGERRLNGIGGLVSQLNKVNSVIDRLLREENGGGGFR